MIQSQGWLERMQGFSVLDEVLVVFVETSSLVEPNYGDTTACSSICSSVHRKLIEKEARKQNVSHAFQTVEELHKGMSTEQSHHFSKHQTVLDCVGGTSVLRHPGIKRIWETFFSTY